MGKLLGNKQTAFTRHFLFVRQHLNDPLYRNSYFLMANTVIISVLGFVFWIIVARFYNEADVGLASTIITLMSLLITLSTLGFDMSFIRFLSKSEKPVEFINTGLTITGIVSILIALLFVAGVDLWSPAISFIKDNIVFIAAFIIFTLFLTLSSMLDSIFIAARRSGLVLVKNAAISILKLALPFIFVQFFRSFGIISSLGTATSIVVAVSLVLLLPKVFTKYKPSINLNWHIFHNVWQYSAANYLTNVLAAATTFVLLNLIVNRLSAEETAYFYMAWIITGLLFIIPGAISQSLFAEGSHFENQFGKNVKRSYKFTFMLLVPAIIILLLAGKWLLLIFGTSYSDNGVLLLQCFAVSGIFIGINSIYGTILRVQGKIRQMMAISICATCAMLTGSFFITFHTGIIGIGYIWLAVQGTNSIYVLFAMRKLNL